MTGAEIIGHFDLCSKFNERLGNSQSDEYLEHAEKAVKKLLTNSGLFIVNLGTGTGYSVLDMIHAFEKACGKKLPYKICERRPGDIAACYACPDKAEKELKWKAKYGIEEMCNSQWKWQSGNPMGYEN